MADLKLYFSGSAPPSLVRGSRTFTDNRNEASSNTIAVALYYRAVKGNPQKTDQFSRSYEEETKGLPSSLVRLDERGEIASVMPPIRINPLLTRLYPTFVRDLEEGIKRSDGARIEELHKQFDFDVNCPLRLDTRLTALHFAAAYGDLPTITLLVEKLQANAAVRDTWGRTPALVSHICGRLSNIQDFLINAEMRCLEIT